MYEKTSWIRECKLTIAVMCVFNLCQIQVDNRQQDWSPQRTPQLDLATEIPSAEQMHPRTKYI